MPRPQFTLKTMLWLMAVVGAFLGGRALGIREGNRHRYDSRALKLGRATPLT